MGTEDDTVKDIFKHVLALVQLIVETMPASSAIVSTINRASARTCLKISFTVSSSVGIEVISSFKPSKAAPVAV